MINSAYNYYLSTYGGKEVSKYDTHKKSELRGVYNSMLKVNKKSPLYKILDTENVQKYAIDIKEAARSLKNVASSLTADDVVSAYMRKKAESSNENLVDVRYIGEDTNTDSVEEFKIAVNKLATPQINTGNYLNPNGTDLKIGEYSFDFSVGEDTYEFSFNVRNGESNKDVQEKISRLVNRSNIGVYSKVISDDLGNTAIEIESANTGVTTYSGFNFKIDNNDKSYAGNAVSILGLDKVSNEANNASFHVNGVEHTAASNVFTLKHQFEVSLKDVSLEDETATIGLKQDFDSIIENVSELIGSYNSIVDLATSHIGKAGDDSNKLSKDIKTVVNYFKNDLDSAGFLVQEDGRINIEESLLIQSANEGTLKDSLEKLDNFKKALAIKADEISIDPINYVNKKLIAYPNPIRNFTSPYVSSIYAGMMFDRVL